MKKQTVEELIIEIKEHAAEAAKKHPLPEPDRTRLEKEAIELTGLLKHYGILRWAISSFFMLASFGVAGHFLSQDKGQRLFAFAGPCIFFVAILIFWLHSQLISRIQEELEAIGEMLGYYSPKYLKETNVKFWCIIIFVVMLVIYSAGIVFLCFLP